MGIYDFNTGSLVIPENSVFDSLNSNSGSIIVGPNCKISECNDNRGSIQFQHGSRVDSIANNFGSIILEPDCVFMKTKNNFGAIVGGKPGQPNFDSVGAHSSHEYNIHYNDRNIFNPTYNEAGGGSNIKKESLKKIFDLLKLDMFGEGLLDSLNSDSNSRSSSSENKVQPSKSKKDVPIPSAPLLDEDIKDNCSIPDGSLSNDADETLCVICLERPKNVAFQCGHLCCANCSEKLQACHMCRVKINQKIKLFL